MCGVFMSATRDRSQKIKLVVSNGNVLNREQLSNQKEELEKFSASEIVFNKHQSHIIKAEDLKKHQVHAYHQPQVSKTIVSKPAFLSQSSTHASTPQNALDGLKQNLKTLNELHSRLKFMLKELEEIVVDK